MTIEDAQRIVRIESLKFAFYGILIALLMMVGIGGIIRILSFIGEIYIGVLSGVIGLFVSVWILGGFLGKLIFKEEMGGVSGAILLSFECLFIGTFSGSFFGQLFDFKSNHGNLLVDSFQGVLVMGLFGGIPTLILGWILGIRIKRKLKKEN